MSIKELEINTQEQLLSIFDALPQGIILHDLNRKITFFSKSAEKITGISKEKAIGTDCHNVFKPIFCSENCLCSNLGVITANEPQYYSTDIITASGEHKNLDVSVVPMVDSNGVVKSVLISFSDKSRLQRLERKLKEDVSFSGIIGQDNKMISIFEMIKDVSDSDASVVITGESGTGKELVANAIHLESYRRDELFVPVNCGALPEGTLESELFGHLKGSFTGAFRDKKGRFEIANGGTLFLDEVGELPVSTQVKLLRVLQDGIIEPVGSEKGVKVDVRIISATNKDLKEMVKKGTFREDLFYRLAVFPIHIPPLRERRLDIPLIAENCLLDIREKRKKENLVFSDSILNILMDFDWPGNIRQLQNAIQYASIRCKSEKIIPEDFPPEIVPREQYSNFEATNQSKGSSKLGRKPKLSDYLVEKAIIKSGGNKAKAARLLNVGRATLYNFLRDNPKDFEEVDSL